MRWLSGLLGMGLVAAGCSGGSQRPTDVPIEGEHKTMVGAPQPTANVTISARAQPTSASLSRCELSTLSLAFDVRDAGQPVEITAVATDARGLCTLDVRANILVVDAAGEPLPIRRNGLAYTVRVDLPDPRVALGVLWRNWCVGSVTAVIRVSIEGRVFEHPVTPPECEDAGTESRLDTVGSEARKPFPPPPPPAGMSRADIGVNGVASVHVHSDAPVRDGMACMELLPWMAPVEHRGEPPGPLVVVECIMSGAERARLLFAWDTDYFLWLDFVELLFPASLSLPSVYDLQCAAVEDSFIPADTSPDTAEYIAICMEKPSRRGAPGDYRDVWIRLPDTPEVRKLAPGDLCWKYSIHLGSKGEGPSVNLACKMEFGGRS